MAPKRSRVSARKPSRPTAAQAAEIKWYLLNTQMKQHDIAAKYGINGGRVSEINTGKRFSGIPPRPPSPPPAAAMAVSI